MTSSKTIADIAKLAGVGTATVDRVLNGRSGVSQETARRVRETMEMLGFDTPARGRPPRAVGFRLAFVLPAARSPLFDAVDRQIAQLAGEFRHQHITEVACRFDLSDPAVFAGELVKLEDFDGIVLLAPDVPAIKLAINELVRAGVHVATLLSDIAGSMRAVHIGVDNRAAGRTAGLLIGRVIGRNRPAKVLMTAQTTRFSAEIDRRSGFAQVLEERFSGIELVRVLDLPVGEDEAMATVAAVLEANGGGSAFAGVYNIGGCTYGVMQACRESGCGEDVVSVAHDLTEGNKRLLASDMVSFILHQDLAYCTMSAAKAMLALRENLRGSLIPAPPKIEIVTQENLS